MKAGMTSAAQQAARTAEKEHVGRLQDTAGLQAKPFLGGTSLSVDRAAGEIAIFGAMVDSLPVGPGALVLDLGSGSCWVSRWLQKLLYRTVSLDLARDMLRTGSKRLAPGSWLCAGDMAAIPLRDNTLDAAVCYAALHHVPDWRTALKEVRRVLRPGGVLIMQEPGRGHSKQAESISQMEQFGVLEQDLPPRALARACRAAGFTRVVVRPVAALGYGRVRILPPYPFLREAPRLFIVKRIRRLLSTVIEEVLNVFSTMHIVVACKGMPAADSRRPDTMVARFERVDCPSRLQAGHTTPISARILNTGLTRWLADPPHSGLGRVRLGISLLNAEGRIADLDFARLELPHDVEPGQTIEIEGAIPPVPAMGKIGLRFDLVAEGINWFCDKGSRACFVNCKVKDA
jgi:SAM-dependent methyltransferase